MYPKAAYHQYTPGPAAATFLRASLAAKLSSLHSCCCHAESLAPNVPVSELNSEYATATRDLAAKIDKYLTLVGGVMILLLLIQCFALS